MNMVLSILDLGKFDIAQRWRVEVFEAVEAEPPADLAERPGHGAGGGARNQSDRGPEVVP